MCDASHRTRAARVLDVRLCFVVSPAPVSTLGIRWLKSLTPEPEPESALEYYCSAFLLRSSGPSVGSSSCDSFLDSSIFFLTFLHYKSGKHFLFFYIFWLKFCFGAHCICAFICLCFFFFFFYQ